MAERPIWDWGLHLHADLWPVRQARPAVSVRISELLLWLAEKSAVSLLISGVRSSLSCSA